MPEMKERRAGGSGDQQPCVCTDCPCETVDDCVHPETTCPHKGSCCDVSGLNEEFREIEEQMRVPA
jgi:hypothetical protein